MSNLLQILNAEKTMGSRLLFEKVSFGLNKGEHVGVIGPNGAGKTTLFKVLACETELDSGEYIRSSQLKIGYLKQESDWDLDQKAEDFVMEKSLIPMWEMKQTARDLGLLEKHFTLTLKELSGGYRMRMQLLKLLTQQPNCLMLDEPTNFLDLETVLSLEKFLQGYSGSFLLISHDREFLKRTTDHTLEIEAGEVTKYPGNIEDYFEQKALLREQELAQFKNQEQKRKHLQSFVDRFRAKATKAKQAQSRMKMLDKMEVIELKALPVRARIPVPAPMTTGKEVLELKDYSCGYTEKNILSKVNLRIVRGDRLGIVGVNGAGKSTLLKSLVEKGVWSKGFKKFGHQVDVAYFAQHSTDELEDSETILEALQRKAHPSVLLQEIKNLAGSLLFSGDDILKKIKVLSGGEKSRVALGQVLLQRKSLILLDEPTNHLDFETVESLTQALQSFEGTIVFISHDRTFVRRVATRILEIELGQLLDYAGTYDDYVWSQQQKLQSEMTESSENKVSEKKGNSSAPEKESSFYQRKEAESELRKLKRKIVELEDLTVKLEQEKLELVEKSSEVGGLEAQLHFKRLSEIEIILNDSETQWLEAHEKVAELEAVLGKKS
ncbi:MAG: ATP-binding cassette domain-containing protein [Proteobacteria bacterium]|jgi:ATP-binding cassette subfamily F protein 3|nr:ATP-binding cassette domain-containing protein [Pseudomonadota bacterium]